MGITNEKTSGRLLALLWSMSVFLLLSGCDLYQLESGECLDFQEERELLSQAEKIFESTVEALPQYKGPRISSEPSHLFDPGDVIPQWKDSYYYKGESDSGIEYWYVCTPVDVDFIFKYSLTGTEEETELVSCSVEMQTVCDSEPSCFLVYAIPEENWFLENVREKENIFQAIRNGKSRFPYCGLLLYTDLKGRVFDVKKYVEGSPYDINPDDNYLCSYNFFAYRFTHTKGFELEAAVCVAYRDPIQQIAYTELMSHSVPSLGDPSCGGNGNYGGSGGGANSTNSSSDNSANSKGGTNLSYDRRACFIGMNKIRNCFDHAKAILAKMNKTVPTIRTNIANEKGEINAVLSAKAVAMVLSNLSNCQPVLMGVTHSNFAELNLSNNNHATQHFIVVTGYQTYGNGYVFIYIETGRFDVNWDEATSENNLLYYDPVTGIISGANYNSTPEAKNKWKDYIVTEIRTN